MSETTFKRNRPPTRTMRWPMPLPGRPEWAWLLGTRLRRWRVRRRLRLLLPHLGDSPVIADIGCGPGFTAAELRRLLPPSSDVRFILLDPQRGMLVRARRIRAKPARRMGSAVLAMADSVRLPLRDDAADAVLSLGVLCCMADESVGAALAEVVRVLRPGGWLLLGVPRWRGSADERRAEEAGLVRRGGERPGIAILQKWDKGEPP